MKSMIRACIPFDILKKLFSKVFILALISFSSQLSAYYAYVVNADDNTISVINTKTNTIIDTITGFLFTNTPTIAITPNGNYAYVTNALVANTVSVINTRTNTVVGTPITVGSIPLGITVTPDGQFVYVVNENDNSISVISTSSNTVVDTIEDASLSVPFNIAISPDGNFAYVTNFVGNSVSVINTNTHAVVAIITSADLGAPNAIAITPNGKFAYVTNDSHNTVSVINLQTNTVTGSPITLSGVAQAIAITPDGNFAYTANNNNNTVSVININTNTVLTTISSANFDFPVDIAITSDGNFAYLLNASNQMVSVINTSSNTVVGNVTGIDFNASRIAIIPVLPPASLVGKQKKNDFGLEYEIVNLLQWEPSVTSRTAGYIVSRNGVSIAVLDASTFKYKDHNRKKGATTTYSVTTFDNKNNLSFPISIQIR